MNSNAATSPATTCNGVDVSQVMQLIDGIQQDPQRAACRFRLQNRWENGGRNNSTIKDFMAGGEEDHTRSQAFMLSADEPAFLASRDTAPNPVEFVLHALAGCLTTTLVYHAAVRGIAIRHVQSSLEGDLDLRGIFGLADEVRKGYQTVRVRMQVDSDAGIEELRELASYSPVYDIVSNSLPVELVIEKP